MMKSASQTSQYKIYDLKQKKLLTVKLHKKLGAGGFGEAFLAESPDYREPLVCKTIDLQAKNEHVHYSYHQLLRFTYREIDYLRKLGLLIGYAHDKENQTIQIVMKLLPGITEYHVPAKLKLLAEYASFRALRKLHRQGIAHLDPHPFNFLYDEDTEHAVAIDFGLAQNAHFFRELRDFYIFLKTRRTTPTLFSATGRDTLGYFIDFYCNELKEHILANRLDAAKTLFCYASVIIAALCGANTLGIASILAQALLKAMILPALSELLEALQDHYELRAFNQRQTAAIRYYSYVVVSIMMILQGLILALQATAFALQISQLFSGITEFGKICTHHQVFWQSCFQAFPLEETLKTLIQLKPWVQICQYWVNNAEKYLFTQNSMTTCYQHKIASTARQPSYLPYFQQTITNRLSTQTTSMAAVSFTENRLSPTRLR